MASFYKLSEKEIEIIIDALKYTYLFDGPGSCPDFGAAEAIVANLLDTPPVRLRSADELDFDHGFNSYHE